MLIPHGSSSPFFKNKLLLFKQIYYQYIHHFDSKNHNLFSIHLWLSIGNHNFLGWNIHPLYDMLTAKGGIFYPAPTPYKQHSLLSSISSFYNDFNTISYFDTFNFCVSIVGRLVIDILLTTCWGWSIISPLSSKIFVIHY